MHLLVSPHHNSLSAGSTVADDPHDSHDEETINAVQQPQLQANAAQQPQLQAIGSKQYYSIHHVFLLAVFYSSDYQYCSNTQRQQQPHARSMEVPQPRKHKNRAVLG